MNPLHIDAPHTTAFLENRSMSDDIGRYLKCVKEIVSGKRPFSYFRREDDYNSVVDNASYKNGLYCIEVIKKQTPELLDQYEKFKINDVVGNPWIWDYPNLGLTNQFTLRYVRVASDLKYYFKNDIGTRIAEIGVGYGGQFLIADLVFKLKKYYLFDLNPVLQLTTEYLENFILNSSYHCTTLNQFNEERVFDLVISNYGFSELPRKLQLKYIEKVLSKARRGYMTMNTGIPGSVLDSSKCLSINELKDLLPRFDSFPEDPEGSGSNYVILWGH